MDAGLDVSSLWRANASLIQPDDRRTCGRFTSASITFQCAPSRVADVEAAARAAPVAFLEPAQVPLDLIAEVEALFDQARRETQRQRRVVCPLAWREAEEPAAGHVRYRSEAASRAELDRAQ